MSGHLRYTYTHGDKDIVIMETNCGIVTAMWSWDLDKHEVARAFWETLKKEIHKRGDLRATFTKVIL